MRMGFVFIFGIIFASLFDGDEAKATNFVVLKANATEEYLKGRAQKQNEIQTYQFMEGRHFEGRSKDKGVEEISFKDIILGLAQHLVKQNFYPNPLLGEGDLLIMVHYGVTDFEEDPLELQGIENMADISGDASKELKVGSSETFDLSGSLNAALGNLAAINSGGHMTRDQKTRMLGIEGMSKEHAGFSNSGYEYNQMLREARYFVVLMAYDFQLFRKHKKAKLLWSTRYSVRSRGQSFETAYKEMNQVASDYFGMNLNTLTRKRLDDTASVKIGEIEVIENESPDPK